MECPYCSLKAADQKVVFRDDLVWFVEVTSMPDRSDRRRPGGAHI
jgi:hypothetical protein